MSNFASELGFGDIVFAGRTLQRRDVVSQILELASFLRKAIAPPGGLIYLFAYNHPKTIVAYFAVLRAGHHCVLIDPATGPLELSEYRGDTTPVADVVPDCRSLDWNVGREIILHQPSRLRGPDFPDMDEPCTLVYTAAEDGYSAAAVLGVSSIHADAAAHAQTNDTDENSVVCSLLPLFHLYGLVAGIVAPCVSGSTILLEDISDVRSHLTLARRLVEHGTTHIYSIPAVYFLLAKGFKARCDLGRLRHANSGAYKMPEQLAQLFFGKWGLVIREGYGLTEAGPMCAYNDVGEDVRRGSVGRALPCCTIEIAAENKDHHAVVDFGEVCIRGTNVMKGYYGQPRKTHKALRNGLLRTGDLGRLGDDGYLYLVGYKKRMVKVRGHSVYPAEVERLLRSNDDIKNVRVYAQNSELEGSVLHAEVKALNNNTMESLRHWCLKNITHYKIPRHIKVN